MHIDEPLVRRANFGTIEQPKALVVYYDETKKTITAFTGTLKTLGTNNNSYRLILANYKTIETEHFDILAQYLGRYNTSIGGDNLGESLLQKELARNSPMVSSTVRRSWMESSGKHISKSPA